MQNTNLKTQRPNNRWGLIVFVLSCPVLCLVFCALKIVFLYFLDKKSQRGEDVLVGQFAQADLGSDIAPPKESFRDMIIFFVSLL